MLGSSKYIFGYAFISFYKKLYDSYINPKQLSLVPTLKFSTAIEYSAKLPIIKLNQSPFRCVYFTSSKILIV